MPTFRDKVTRIMGRVFQVQVIRTGHIGRHAIESQEKLPTKWDFISVRREFALTNLCSTMPLPGEPSLGIRPTELSGALSRRAACCTVSDIWRCGSGRRGKTGRGGAVNTQRRPVHGGRNSTATRGRTHFTELSPVVISEGIVGVSNSMLP